MNKLKVRFMLVVCKFIYEMYDHYKATLSYPTSKVRECEDLIKDLEVELETE